MKKASRFFGLMLCGITVFGSVACGGKVIDKVRTDREQIYVNVYNGGVGTEWFDNLKNEWNAQNEKYEIIAEMQKKEESDIRAEIETGVSSQSKSPLCYFSISSSFKKVINADSLLDLTDFLEMKPDGEDGMTVKEKLSGYYDDWQKIASNDTKGGIYMLPWNESMNGFVYNHDDFLSAGWLYYAENTQEVKDALTKQGIKFEESGERLTFVSSENPTNYKEGGYILRAGKDGKYGTYDDGQPITESEWSAMLKKIATIPTSQFGSARPFIWTGYYESAYTSYLKWAMMAQHSGAQFVKDYCSHDSEGRTYKMHDGTTTSWTIDDGYKAYSAEASYRAMKFYSDYIMPNGYRHPAADDNSVDHGTAQSKFIYGNRKEKSNPYSAMIVEGSWWENEARPSFAANDRLYPERSFGKCDYRYMLLPYFDGGVQAFGNGKGTAVAISEASSFFVVKPTDYETQAAKDKIEALKDFLLYTLKEESLRKTTVLTGVVRPYKYTLTQEDKAKMTPFARNNYDLYMDEENISRIRSSVYLNVPISYATTGFENYPIYTDIAYSCIIKGLRGAKNDLDGLFNTSSKYFTAEKWDTLVKQARANGFYTTK